MKANHTNHQFREMKGKRHWTRALFLTFLMILGIADVNAGYYEHHRTMGPGESFGSCTLDFAMGLNILEHPVQGTVTDTGASGSGWCYAYDTGSAPYPNYEFTFQVQGCNSSKTQCGDAYGYDHDKWFITINANNPPTISLSPTSTIVDEGVDGYIQINASDPDGDPITLQYSRHHFAATTWPTNGSGQYRARANVDADTNDYFQVRACDDQGACSSYVNGWIRINDINSPPTAGDITITTNEDVWSAYVDTGASDTDGDAMSLNIVNAPTNGSVQISGTTVRYKGAADWYGSDTFNYEICDAKGACSPTYTANVTVNAVNDPPDGGTLDFNVNAGVWSDWKSLTVVDPDGPAPYTVTLDTPPQHGTAEISGISIRYRGLSSYSGTDNFTYKICDNAGACKSGLPINVTVNGAPTASDITIAVPEDTWSPETFIGASDPENDPLTLQIVTSPVHGTVEVLSGNSLRYKGNMNFNGADSFTYQVCDPGGLCSATHTADVTVSGVNDPPTVNSVNITVYEGGDYSPWTDTGAVDPDGDPITLTIYDPPKQGIAGISGTKVRYKSTGLDGTDSFRIEACDSYGACSGKVDVNVTILRKPRADNNISISTPEDTWSVFVDVNASDVANDPLTLQITVSPSNGSTQVSGTTVRYLGDLNYNGSDNFNFVVCNTQNSCSDTRVANVTVTPVNDPPTAQDVTITTVEDMPATVDINVNDPEDNDFSVNIIAAPAHGIASGQTNRVPLGGPPSFRGEVTYTPNANYVGADSFTYQVCDIDGACSPVYMATVNVTPVNDPPVIDPQSFTTAEDTPGTFAPVVTDPDAGDTYTLELNGPASNGSVSFDNSATPPTFSYTPNPNWFGTDSFDIKACDAGGLCDTAIMTINVTPVNDAPTLDPITLHGLEDIPTMAVEVVTSDIEGDNVTWTIKTQSDPAEGQGEKVTDSNGIERLRFVPAAQWYGTTQLTIEACDDGTPSLCSILDVPVIIDEVNDPPIVNDVYIITDEDMVSGKFNVIASDPEGDDLTYMIDNTGVIGGYGLIDPDPAAPKVWFSPKPDWFGTDTFQITVCDTEPACAHAVAHVDVSGINDAPVLDDVSLTTEEDTVTAPYTLQARDADTADTITYTLKTAPPATEGVVTLSGDVVSFMPAVDWNGDTSFVVEACDDNTTEAATGGVPACIDATINVSVVPKNDPPTATQGPLTTDEDTAVTGTPVITDPDAGDTHTLVLVSAPAHGSVTMDNTAGANKFTFLPAKDWFGQETLEINVCDQGGLCSLLTVNVDVLPVNDPPTDSELEITVKKDTQSIWMQPLVLDPDPEQSFTFSIVDSGADLSAIVDPSLTRISVLPNSGFSGNTTFTYQVCDQDSACIEAIANVKVLEDIYHKDGVDAYADIALVSGGYPKISENEYPITSQVVYRANGLNQPVTETMDLAVTWHSGTLSQLETTYGPLDADQTTYIRGYNFAENGNRVVIPARFGSYHAPGPVGDVDIQVIDPSTGEEDPLVPNIHIEVSAWDPAESVVFAMTGASDASGAVAKMVEKVTIRAQTTTGNVCGSGLLSWDSANSWKYEGVQACGIEWIDLPEGLEPTASGMQPVLSGRFTDPSRPASEEITWKTGLIQTNGAAAEFLPALSNGAPYRVDLYEPTAPSILFSPTSELSRVITWVPGGYWPAKVGTDKQAGYLRGTTDFDGIVANLNSGGIEKTQTSVGGSVSISVETNLAAEGDSESMSATVSYLYDSSLSSSLDLSFMATPDMPTMFVDRITEAMTGSTLEITGRIGKYDVETSSIQYDPATLGKWVVRLYRYDRDTGNVMEAGPLSVDPATGGFSLPINVTAEMGSRIDLFVEGTLLKSDNSENTEATIKSSSLNIVVRDTSPIEITASAMRDNGPVPFLAFPSIRLVDGSRYADIGEIQWEYSTDGITFQPVPDLALRAYRIGERLTEPGKRWYRATTVNRFSGATSSSNIVEVQAYRTPNIEVTGYQRTFIGHPVTWTATNLAGDSTEYVWEVYKDSLKEAPIRTETGDSIVLGAAETGRYYVRLKATPLDSSGIDSASKTIVKGLSVQPPYLRRPGVMGPRYAEAGKTYTFQAINGPIFYGSDVDLTLGQEWELPNGVIVSGSTVDYTIQPGDTSLKYRVWVNGYKAETLIEVEKTFYAWEYEWPTNWEINVRETTVISPARVVLYTYTTPRTDIRKMGLEKPVYVYNTPPEANIVFEYGNKLVVDLPTPSVYPIEVLIRDERGNEELATISITATDPPPLSTDIAVNVNDRWFRAPSLVTPKLYILNPISGEKVTSHKVYLDGMLISDKPSVYVDSAMVNDVGSHEIVSELTMDSGRTAMASHSFDLVEGDLPNCTIGFTEYASYTTAQLRCTVTMGYVKRMEWYATFSDTGNEEKLSLTGFYGIFRDTMLDRGITALRIVVYNDKGQITEVNSAFP